MTSFGLVLILAIVAAFVGIAFRVVTGTPVRYALRQSGGALLCRMIGHRRRRATVRKIGATYLGRCRICDIRMTREGRQGEWRVMSPTDHVGRGGTSAAGGDRRAEGGPT